MADAMKLLPCPFCGQEAHVDKEHGRTRVFCSSPICPVTSLSIDSFGDDGAIEAWNCRASPPATDEGAIEAVMEVRIANPSGWTTPSRQEAEKLVQAALRTSEPEK